MAWPTKKLEEYKETTQSEFIWFFGPSAAGKATLVKSIAKDCNHFFRNRLRLLKSVKVCEQSLLPEREGLIKSIVSLHEPDTSILIKGQGVDLNKKFPPELRNKFPQSRHRVVFLWCDPKEMKKRWDKRRGNTWKNRSVPECKGELDYLIKQAKVLSSLGFGVECFDSSDMNYKKLDCNELFAQ